MSTEDNILENELNDILHSVARSKNLKNYEVFINKNTSKGDGFLSEFFTGEVLDNVTGEMTNVAIKKAPTDSVKFMDAGNDQPYQNELNFYSKIFPELNKFQIEKGVKYPFNYIPKYLAGNADTKNMYIAMENLKSEGYTLFDKTKYLDKEHLEFIFKIYGKFHALSFTFQQKNAEDYKNVMGNILNVFKEILSTDGAMNLMRKIYSSTIELFDLDTEADIVKKFKKLENVGEAFEEAQKYEGNYKCFTHGDCWSNNMLFKYKECGELEDIKLLDFQLNRCSTPVHDLAYFFYAGASKEDMDKLDYYLDVYYESFSNFTKELGGNPAEILPLETLKNEWKQYAILGVILGLMLWPIKLTNKEEFEDVLNQKGLPESAYWDLFSEKLSKTLKGPLYRERARNLCFHAVEYGVV